MDTPQVTPGLLELALRLLADGTVDAVLGPAADGGFWLLGLQRPRSGDGTRRAHVHRQDGGGATRQAGGRRLPVARSSTSTWHGRPTQRRQDARMMPHAEQLAGRAAMDCLEGDRIRAGHVVEQGAKLTVAHRRAWRAGGQRVISGDALQPVFAATPRPALVLVPQTCALAVPSATCRAPR